MFVKLLFCYVECHFLHANFEGKLSFGRIVDEVWRLLHARCFLHFTVVNCQWINDTSTRDYDLIVSQQMIRLKKSNVSTADWGTTQTAFQSVIYNIVKVIVNATISAESLFLVTFQGCCLLQSHICENIFFSSILQVEKKMSRCMRGDFGHPDVRWFELPFLCHCLKWHWIIESVQDAF